MSNYDGSIVIKTAVDQTGIKTGIAGISASLKKLAGTVALAFGVRAIVNMGESAIQLASDLEEVQNVVDTAFGSMSYKIEEFSQTSIEQFGISELSAKSMASTFVAMGNGIGQGLETGSDMAVELTGRLADVMSFYNKSMSEVETIGRSIYSAETESLKQIGVIMTQTNLETFALAQGYQTLYGEMEANEQLLIRQKFFLNATEQAAGDFAKTQDSWANSTRVLSERWNEFLTIIGTRLIQVLTPVVNFLNTILTAAINVATAISNILGFEAEVATTESSVSGLSDAESDLASSTEEANAALEGQAAAFDKVNVLSSSTGGTSTLSSTSGGTSIDYGEASGLVQMASQLELTLRPLIESVQNLFDAIGSFGGNFFKGFIGYFQDLINLDIPIISDGINSVADAIRNISPEQAEKLGRSFAEIATGIFLMNTAVSAATKVTAFFAGLKTTFIAISGMSGTVATVVNTIFSIANPALWPALTDWTVEKNIPVISTIIDWFRSDWKESELLVRIDEGIRGIIDYLGSALVTTFTFDNLFSFGWATQLAEITKTAFEDIVESFETHDWTNLGQNIMFLIGGGLLTGLSFVFEPIIAFVEGAVNIVIAGVNSIIGAINTISDSSISTIPFLSLAVPDTSYLSDQYNIPQLAQGAVIPPNKRFLAMLGDQTSGTNIEAPLDTIVSAMNIALASQNTGVNELLNASNNNSNQTVSPTLELDGETFAKVVTPYIISELNRTGTTLTTVEV